MDFKKNDECLFIDDDNIKKCIYIGQNDNIFQFKGVDDKHDFYLTQQLAEKLIVKVSELEKSSQQEQIQEFYINRMKASNDLLQKKIDEFNKAIKEIKIDSSLFSEIAKEFKINKL